MKIQYFFNERNKIGEQQQVNIEIDDISGLDFVNSQVKISDISTLFFSQINNYN